MEERGGDEAETAIRLRGVCVLWLENGVLGCAVSIMYLLIILYSQRIRFIESSNCSE